jgi:hypothetical protein
MRHDTRKKRALSGPFRDCLLHWALNRITDERHRTNRSLAMIAREALEAKKSPKLPMQIKSG